MEVYVGAVSKSTRVELTDSDKIASGGNGTVYQKKGLAWKIYHQHDPVQIQKLKDLLKANTGLPDEMIMPMDLLLKKSGEEVGLNMRLLGAGYEPVTKLRTPNFINQFNITPIQVTRIFQKGIPLVTGLHRKGFKWGDFNDKNAFFNLSKLDFLGIDGDSLAFGKYGSQGTEFFLDPKLYGKNLSDPVFTEGNDWFSYAIMLYWSLLLEHPYGGTHRKVRDLLNRMQNRITLLDVGVIYPNSSARPQSVLNAEMLQLFDDYFKKDKREPFPSEVLDTYIEDLELSRTHGQTPPKKKVITMPGAISATDMLTTHGKIVYTALYDDILYVIAHEGNLAVLYMVSDRFVVPKRILLFTAIAGTRYGIVSGYHEIPRSGGKLESEPKWYLVTNAAYSEELQIYKLHDSGPVKLPLDRVLQTKIFATSKSAMFKTSKSHIFVMQGNAVTALSIVNDKLVPVVLRGLRDNQTWFVVEPESAIPRLCGYYTYYNDYYFWIINENGYFDVPVQQINIQEALVDISVKVTKHGTLLLRKTEFKGNEYIYLAIVDEHGKVRHEPGKVRASKHEYIEIHGRLYARVYDESQKAWFDIVMHPTSEGVKQENVTSTNSVFTYFDGSEAYVGSSDLLYPHPAGLMVVKSDQVILIA